MLETKFDHTDTDQKSFEIFVKNLISNKKINEADQLLKIYSNQWKLSSCKLDLSAKILIENMEFQRAEKILSSLVEIKNDDPEYLIDYCLAVLECRLSDFPFGINAKKIERINSSRIVQYAKDYEGNLFLELMEAELDFDNRLEKYKQLLLKYSDDHNPEVWRIFAGLGSMYFEKQQYDSAIINIKRAFNTIPNNERLFWLLIRCYGNLRLWNEIERMFLEAPDLCKQAIKFGLKNLGIFSDSPEWCNYLENQVLKRPDEIIFKIMFAQSLVENNRKAEAAAVIKSFYKSLEVEDEYYLYCVQILLDSDESVIAERLIEIYLANKRSLTKKDYLASAFIYDQLGKFEKSLAMIAHSECHDPAILTYKAILLSGAGNFELPQTLLNQIMGYSQFEMIDLHDLSVRIPDEINEIRHNPALVFSLASSLEVKNKNMNKAISILDNGLEIYPQNQEIIFALLDLMIAAGYIAEVERTIMKCGISISKIQSANLLCLIGEISLSQKEEVTCARYLSEAIKIEADNIRVRALRARMVAINGNIGEAQNILNLIIDEINNTERNQKSNINSLGLANIKPRLWLAQAALETKEYVSAINISLEEINDFGYYRPIISVYLTALSAMLEKEFILSELKINSLPNSFKEKQIDVFSDIKINISNMYSSDKELSDLVIKCQIYLENDLRTFSSSKELDSRFENINPILYSIYQTMGQEAAEIAFNSFKTNLENEFFLATLEKDENPQAALSHLKKFMEQKGPDASAFVLLAIIENNLGNHADAYAAISLALDQKPEEFEWQIMAGNFSKTMGDLHASEAHYQKAQTIYQTSGLDKNIDAIYLSSENQNAIPILEKQLRQNLNKEQLIQLGKLCLKFGYYHKAVNAFETAVQNFPEDAIPYYWLSTIAFKLNNFNKSLENIEKAIIKDQSNIRFICKKAQILNKVAGSEKAISFLDDELSKNNDADNELLLAKIKLVEENSGDKSALKIINSIQKINYKYDLLFEKAKLELQLGNIEVAESIAEKLLNQKDFTYDGLVLYGLATKARGEFDRAIDFFVKAIELNPYSSEEFIHLAEIYHDKKDLKMALDTLEDGIKTNSGDFNLLFLTGLYYYQQGLYFDSEKRIKEAIRIQPDHKEAKEILELLRNVTRIESRSAVSQIA